jgi:acid stress chaperone HdeB
MCSRSTIERKLYMKMLAALFFGFCLLSGGAARAEKIDFSTTTCKQFLESHKDSIGIILAWLDGYYQDEDDPPVFDTDKFEANAKKLGAFCAANPELGLITATDKLFGK